MVLAEEEGQRKVTTQVPQDFNEIMRGGHGPPDSEDSTLKLLLHLLQQVPQVIITSSMNTTGLGDLPPSVTELTVQ